MMISLKKYFYNGILLGAFTLLGCSDEDAGNKEATAESLNTEQLISSENDVNTSKVEKKLSVNDTEIAYEMCVSLLTDYYKAVWNGSNIELNTFIKNENLKHYLQKKIQEQSHLYSAFNDKVQNVEIGAWETEFVDDTDGGYLYLKIPADIKKSIGGFGEVNEFLVRSLNGSLVIVDWYNGSKDSYDFLVRGENITIDDPNIWNDSEWVKVINNKQNDFSGTTR